MSARLALAAAALAAAACRSAPEGPGSSLPIPDGMRDEIIVCGERIPIGAPVVPWFEPPGYSAYGTEPRFADDGPIGLRYRPGRVADDPDTEELLRAGDLEALQERVDLFVLHYDACGTSERCFRVLQDLRQLSVHFLLDVDGTLYQTLDLQDQAWHARQANPRSIGIEIAHIGAYPAGESSPLDEWYTSGEAGPALSIPEPWRAGVRTAGFEGAPARPERIVGSIQGDPLVQYDFTPEQYASLEKLTAALARTFPRITLDVPRTAEGAVRTDVLSDDDLARFSGLLGHYHVSERKVDPGPAFDWERFLEAARNE